MFLQGGRQHYCRRLWRPRACMQAPGDRPSSRIVVLAMHGKKCAGYLRRPARVCSRACRWAVAANRSRATASASTPAPRSCSSSTPTTRRVAWPARFAPRPKPCTVWHTLSRMTWARRAAAIDLCTALTDVQACAACACACINPLGEVVPGKQLGLVPHRGVAQGSTWHCAAHHDAA